ncbi:MULTISPECIES: hypothetical protein [Pseudomonas]|uniref:Uncharacterized protein n=2 Tax=Pseudomonas TaxID=286 RepID=A0A0W0HV69_PSEFL|nr:MULTISPECIES: hypothetical protein [Pseudomonas]KTB64873.1 hypothetical protein AO063_22910 [Pseudomonas fluorescens ICMP 11288]RMQ88148.1 hypothetical protein ALP97_02024 [Pseudomonas salomonii]
MTAENNGVVSKYEFDTEKGQIKNLGNLTVPRPPEYIQNEVCKIEEFFPDKELSNRTDGMNALANFMPGGQTVWGIGDDGKRPSLDHTQPSATDAPYMFTHPRAHHIADSIVKALDLDNPAIKKAAMETTYAEKIVEKEKVLTNFFLDLIPFRSAIVNFMDGNYSEGISDVTWDIFGFVTAGIGAAAKAGKALAKGGSALNKALKVSKVMVPPLLKELNPLDGIGDLITGTRKVLYEGVGAARDGLRTLKGTASREGLIGASVHHNVAATGAFQVGGQTVQGSAVLQNGKWYAYNPVNGRPYGKPLAMFTADSVAMAGEMQNFRILGSGLGMSSDITKRGPRLTLDAHGLMNAGDNSALMAVNGSYLSAYELVDLLKAKGVDLSKYTEIRLTMCHSASGGERSFAATLARLTKKPVKGYQGVMQTTGEVEDVARQMFKDGGALQREFIADNIIGQKKRAVKHRMTHLTADNRGVYGPNPDYNPVNFTAEGTVVQRNKPVRPGYIGDKIETGTAPDKFGPSQDVDFDEYDDLT